MTIVYQRIFCCGAGLLAASLVLGTPATGQTQTQPIESGRATAQNFGSAFDGALRVGYANLGGAGGAAFDLSALYRTSRSFGVGALFGYGASDASTVSLVGIGRIQGTSTISPSFEFGGGYGSALSHGSGVIHVGAGLHVNIPLANNAFLFSVGPEATAELWTFGDLYLRYLIGVDARFVIPFGQARTPSESAPEASEASHESVGPTRFILIESVALAAASDTEPEITRTPAYDRLLPTVHHVAIQAPSECENLSATRAAGQAAGAGREILHTTCGVEMAEVERRLTRQGFQVASWRALANMVEASHMTPTAAAAQLGAQVLFQVNSLQRSNTQVARRPQWTQSFRTSDPLGRPGRVLPMAPRSAALAAQIGALAREAETSAINVTRRLGASLDVTATAVATGQSIWFFQWNHMQPFDETERVTTLVSCTGGSPCVLARPRGQEVTPSTQTTNTPSSAEQDAADPDQAKYARLVREAIDRFVTSFQPSVGQGTSVGSALPAPAETTQPTPPAAPTAPSAEGHTEQTSPSNAAGQGRAHRHRH